MVWFTGGALGMEEWAADGTRDVVSTVEAGAEDTTISGRQKYVKLL